VELEKVVADLMQKVERRFYGKYRGFVVNNMDPKRLGRLTLRVPSVLGRDVVTGWAMPCVPFGGQKNQGFLCIPDVGAGVWVEFEEGDLEFPIWVGTFWSEPGGESEIPTLNEADGKERKNEPKPPTLNGTNGQEPENEPKPPTRKIIKTQKGHTIQFEDADKEEMVIIVEATHKHVVALNKDGIQITDGVNGNKIIMGKDGIQIGSSGASEPFVLGNQFATNVDKFLKALTGHTHALTSPGGPTGVPIPPPATFLTLDVPRSAKHKVE
jgi:Type VI secretion system/phage-baseplate injector OB domain